MIEQLLILLKQGWRIDEIRVLDGHPHWLLYEIGRRYTGDKVSIPIPDGWVIPE